MCTNPVTIYNPSHYLSLNYSERFRFRVPCGKCAECRKAKHDEWYYRIYHEMAETYRLGGYCLFDTLTYRNRDLPHLSEFVDDLSKDLDFPCFDADDVRLFMSRLRRYLSYRNYDVKHRLRFFLCCEYGTEEHRTHRPHIHILFFVLDPKLSPLVLSRAVSKCWFFGRTDGCKYKGKKYVLSKRVIREDYDGDGSKTGFLRMSNYVAKYLVKNSEFQKQIDWRLSQVVWDHMLHDCEYINSVQWEPFDGYFGVAHRATSISTKIDYKRLYNYIRGYGHDYYLKIKRLVNPFHRQSLHFGEIALRDLDVDNIVHSGQLVMPDCKKIKVSIPLPTYYKRKLFQELVEVNGQRCWQYNDLGKMYLNLNNQRLVKLYADKFSVDPSISDPKDLANYFVNYSGRFVSNYISNANIQDRLDSGNLVYPYLTRSDRLHFGSNFISFDYLGNIRHWIRNHHKRKKFNRVVNIMPIELFDRKYVYHNSKYDKLIDNYFSKIRDIGDKSTKADDIKNDLFERLKLVDYV